MSASILIIDDEIKMGKALRHVLIQSGYEVDAVNEPEAGLDLLARGRHQVVLCDLKMPGMGGLDVLVRCREIQPDVSVIMMTAYASAETAVEAMKKGAYDYLIKPFATDELKILIDRCLGARKLKEENEFLRERLQERDFGTEIVAVSAPMRAVLERARKVARSEATVLTMGPSMRLMHPQLSCAPSSARTNARESASVQRSIDGSSAATASTKLSIMFGDDLSPLHVSLVPSA